MQYNNYCHDFTYQTVLMCMQCLLEGMFRVRICNEQHENNCVKANFCGVYAIKMIDSRMKCSLYSAFLLSIYYRLPIIISDRQYEIIDNCCLSFTYIYHPLISKFLYGYSHYKHAKDSKSYLAPPGDNFSTPNRLYGRRLLHF